MYGISSKTNTLAHVVHDGVWMKAMNTPDLFAEWRVIQPLGADHYVLLRGDQVKAQGSLATIRLNPYYCLSNHALRALSPMSATAG